MEVQIQKKLKQAINFDRTSDPRQCSAEISSYFLQSITATCQALPHTNEASSEVQKKYFSYLAKFGLPCLFLTITSDDKNNFCIVAYSTTNVKGNPFNIDISNIPDEDVIAKCNLKKRFALPGTLCRRIEWVCMFFVLGGFQGVVVKLEMFISGNCFTSNLYRPKMCTLHTGTIFSQKFVSFTASFYNRNRICTEPGRTLCVYNKYVN